MDDELLQGLLPAVEQQPENDALRLHVAEVLVGAGCGAEAVTHVAAVLARSPGSAEALVLMARALGGFGPAVEQAPPTGFDWSAAEDEVGGVVAPMFVDGPEQSCASPYEVGDETLTLADVGGMAEVKKRLNAAFLAVLSDNPDFGVAGTMSSCSRIRSSAGSTGALWWPS